MPDRIYLPPDPNNLKLRDRIGAHWHAYIINLAGLGLGPLILAGAIDEKFDPAPSLADLPAWEVAAVSVCLILGALAWLVSMSKPFQYVDDFWKVQRVGLIAQMVAWLAYTLCALAARPGWVVPWWLGGWFFIAHAGDLFLSYVQERRLRGMQERHPLT